MSHGHDNHVPVAPSAIRLPMWTLVVAGLCVAAGAATFLWTLLGGHVGLAWSAYLAGAFYALGLGVFGVLWIAMTTLTKGTWAVSMRRIPEAMAAWIIPGAILTILVGLGSHTLYSWTDEAVVAADHFLVHKKAFLNMGVFYGISAVAFLVWTGFSIAIVWNSLRQDTTGKVSHSRAIVTLSAAFVVLFALTFSAVSFLYLMSLEPHWFSTMFAVLTFTDVVQTGMAFVCLVAAGLVARGAYNGLVNANHLHAAGTMLFATTGFWAYIYFCQFLLIWYVNIPEETIYFLRRMDNGWLAWILVLPVLKFVVPFLFLVPRMSKRTPWKLMAAGAWVLMAQFVELFVMVAPALGHGEEAVPAHAPIVEALVTLGFLGAFFLVFAFTLQRRAPVPVKDPGLRECLEFHH
jgi:hypothetical protein